MYHSVKVGQHLDIKLCVTCNVHSPHISFLFLPPPNLRHVDTPDLESGGDVVGASQIAKLANSLRDFALQSMFDLLITFANRQLSGITSMYALRLVDLKDMVVIDLWNAGEQRPVETLIRRRVISGRPVAGPGTSQNWAAGAQGRNHCFLTGVLAHWTARPRMLP